ncbi:MAG TPA: SMC family ATPase, partial [Gemmatimonadales bacterium]
MELQRIKLINFRQHADTDVILGKGLTAVIGPNGVGKTTLLEAIAWALYGAPAARGNRDSIRFNRAPARATVRVEVTFVLGAHTYRVARGLNTAELFQDNQPEAVANSGTEVTLRVARLLGMTREEFFNTYFTGQKELAVMANLGAADRARFLSQILGYERLKLAQDRLRTQRSNLKSERDGLESGLPKADELERERALAAQVLSDAQSKAERATAAQRVAQGVAAKEGPAWVAANERRDRHNQVHGDLQVADHSVEAASETFQRLDKEMREAIEAKSQLDKLNQDLKPVPALKAELDRLDQEAKAVMQHRQLTGQLQKTEESVERTRKRLAALGNVQASLKAAEASARKTSAELEKAARQRDAQHTAITRERQEAETKLAQHVEQFRDLERHLDDTRKAGRDGVCPTCARALGDEFDAVMAELTRQLDEVRINGKYFKQRVAQLKKDPVELKVVDKAWETAKRAADDANAEVAKSRELEKKHAELSVELAQHEKSLQQLKKQTKGLPDTYDEKKHDVVRDKLKELEPVERQAARLAERAEHAARLVKEAEGAEKVLSERETRAKQLAAALKDTGFSDARFAEARERHESADRAQREADLQLERSRGEVRTAEAQVAQSAKRIAERATRGERLAALAEESHYHDALDEALSDLRQELNEQLRPELSELASAWLADLTDGRYHEL